MDYIESVRAFGRPSDEQLRAFSNHVSVAHSWYKKLPIDEPGEAFFVYPSPNIHMAWVETVDGPTVTRPFVRHRDQRGFRRIGIALEPGDVEPEDLPPLDYVTGGVTTEEYRAQFGIQTFWNFSRPAEPRAQALASATHGAHWRTSEGTDLPVPEAVLDKGLVYLTAGVHPMFELRRSPQGRSRCWP